MYVKFPLRDLNLDTCPAHLTCTYTYGVIMTLKVCSGLQNCC